MKYIFSLITILFIIVYETQGQTPSIKMTTNEIVGNSFNFSILSNVENTKIQVDWGDGVLKDYSISNVGYTLVSDLLKSHTIKIYGSNISRLEVWFKKLTLIDISSASDLIFLNCSYNQLKIIDVSRNAKLKYLYCNDNFLRNLDISNNFELAYLGCENNLLTTLDVSKNTSLIFLRLFSNRFSFSELPIKQSGWIYYSYSPQTKVKLSKRKYEINETIDLSSQLIINGNSTAYRWKKEDGTVLVKDLDYSEDKGKFSFLTNQENFIYCEMTNATFPDLTLESELIKVPTSNLAITMETENPTSNLFTINIASVIENNKIQVDWGDGFLVDFIVGTSSTNISGLLTGSTIKIYGFGITELNVQSKGLTKLDVSEATELKNIDCSSNKLVSLNLSNNIKLVSVQCQLNQINSILLPNSTELTNIQCQQNKLTFTTLPKIIGNYINYIYYPQSTIVTSKRKYDISEVIDLSKDQFINNIATEYKWKTKGGLTLKKDIDYSESFGEFNFINVSQDSVFCEMTNTNFPDLVQKSNTIAINCPKPTFTMVSSKPIGSYFAFFIDYYGFYSGTTIVDWGDGKLIGYSGGGYASIVGKIAGDTIKVYGVNLSGINVSSLNLTWLDISGNTELDNLDCSGNQLTSLDISKNIKLVYLSCSVNKLTSLDISKNISIKNILCYQNNLNTIDLSYNNLLQNIDCSGNRLTEINITKNSLLETLNCSSNNLITLNTTNNYALKVLLCYDNKLNTLFVSNNSVLKTIQCQFNQLTFITLPPVNNYTSYYYYVQASLDLQKRDYSTGELIDLSSQLTVDGYSTEYKWKNANGNNLIKGIDYSEEKGKFTFLRTQEDYVFCQMTNSKFPDLILSTDTIAIPPTDPLVTFLKNSNNSSEFSFNIGFTTSTNYKPIRVDWGNGSIVDCSADNFGYFNGISTGNIIKIYGIGIKSLFVESQNITDLKISNTNILNDINCNSNQLTSIDISKATSLVTLDCSSNKFTSLEIKSSSLKYLNCSSNQLSSIDISKANSLNYLNCSSNQLTSIDLSGAYLLKNLNCSLNRLTFNTLPLRNDLNEYTYYPQQTYRLPKTNYGILEPIDLSSLFISNGNFTNYYWRSNEILTSPIRYTYNNGVFSFQDECNNIYCLMTNSSFPNLTLRTNLINIKKSTSIDESVINVKIYPNPIKDFLNIECLENISKIEIFTITGIKVYEKQGDNSTKMCIPTFNFQNGFYIVKIFVNNGSFTRKFLKE